jgi:hypothetical protein
MAGLYLETPPLCEPITLAAMKLFLRVDFTADDTLIAGLITGARELVEKHTNRDMVNKGWVQTLDSFPYYVDTTQSQRAYPVNQSYPAYSSTFWNYSQMIRLLRGGNQKNVNVDYIAYLSNADQQWHTLQPGTPPWYPFQALALGTQVLDGNGNIQQVITVGSGKATANPPAFSAVITGTVTDTNGNEFENMGPAPFDELNNQAVATTFICDSAKEPAQVFPGAVGSYWPTVMYAPSAVQIHFTAGQGAAVASGSPVVYTPPTTIRSTQLLAMQMLANGWYEHREAVTPLTMKELPMHVAALLASDVIPMVSQTRG